MVRIFFQMLQVVRLAALLIVPVAMAETSRGVAPELDFSMAVGTPGVAWDRPVVAGSGKSAFAMADSAAVGGTLGVLPYRTSIAAKITGPAIIVILSDQTPDFQVDGAAGTMRYLPARSSAKWFAFAMSVPPAEHEIRFSNLYSSEDLRIDQINTTPAPHSLDEVFGLPAGSITTGGGAWEPIPMLNLGTYAARANVTTTTPAWFELPVKGPAAISFDMANNGGWKTLSLLVDGTVTALWGAESLQNPFQIELPKGTHVVRFLAKSPDEYYDTSPLDVTITRLQVTPVTAGLVAALEGGLPVSVKGGWTAVSNFPKAENSTAVQPDVLASGSQKSLQIGFTGPGFLDFRWYDDGSNGWGAMTGGSDHYRRSFPYGSGRGWRDERVWFPPGPRLVEWLAFDATGNSPRVALDAVRFTPTSMVNLGDALPGVTWENDPNAPWIGASKGADGVGLSPEVNRGETSRLATTLTGPGTLSFRWNNVGATYGPGEFRLDGKSVAWLGQSQSDDSRQTVTVILPGPLPVLAEWVASTPVISREKTRVELDQVNWRPFQKTDLAVALDTSSDVRWKTAATFPFTGREDAGARNLSSAYVALRPGQSSWLEAIVDGPGFFDFWIRKVAGMDISENLWNYWTVTIDGKTLAIQGTSWPAQFISGSGQHRIRFTLRHSAGSGLDWLASAVDDVSWAPLRATPLAAAAGLPGSVWQTGKPLPAEGFTHFGRDGGPSIFLQPGKDTNAWVGTVLTGPCEISWDSTLEASDWRSPSAETLRVDGVDVLPFYAHSWQRMRLTLPEGKHDVRWVSKPLHSYSDGPSATNFTTWRLGGVKIRQGISPLADALDFPGLFALETGDAGGKRLLVGKDNAWKPGEGSALYFFDPTKSGKIITTWGRPDSVAGYWTFEDSSGRFSDLVAPTAAWQQHIASITLGTFLKWTYPGQDGNNSIPAPLLKRLQFSGSAAIPPSVAIGSPGPVATSAWLGLTDPLAKSGQDSAWSLINNPQDLHHASVTLTGPAKVSYWWKKSGTGSLGLYLDDAILPVAPAGAEWTRVEFEINAGDHVVRWTHAPITTTSYAKSGEAFVDSLTLAPAAPATRAVAAAPGTSLDPVNVSTGEAALAWHPVAYREADGSWTRAARAVAGSSALSVTVNGPAVLKFRGRCFADALKPAGQGNVRPSVIITIPGDSTQVLGHFLSVKVGAANPLRISTAAAGIWTDGAVHVPEGVHEVTFRLQTLKSNIITQFIEDTTDPTLQGWITDLHQVSTASHFAAWAQANQLTPGNKGADADGDGAPDYLEYAFGTNPRDPASIPPPLEMTQISDGRTAPRRVVKLPYLPSQVSGVLQSSSDLNLWQDEPVPLLHYAPPQPNFILGDPIYPYVAVPLDVPQKFYRISISGSAP